MVINIMNKKLKIFLLLLLFNISKNMHAQKPIFAYAKYREYVILPSGKINFTQALTLDDISSSIMIYLTAKAPLLKIWMISPSGIRYPISREQDENGDDSSTTVKHYYGGLGRDILISGEWTLLIQSDFPLQKETKSHITLSFTPKIVALVNPTKPQITLGEEEIIETFVSDMGTKIINVQIQGQIVRLDDPDKVLQPIPFIQDPLKEAGVYSAKFTPTLKGEYQVLVKFEGRASTGHFKRTAEAEFKVANKSVSITSNISVRPRVSVQK